MKCYMTDLDWRSAQAPNIVATWSTFTYSGNGDDLMKLDDMLDTYSQISGKVSDLYQKVEKAAPTTDNEVKPIVYQEDDKLGAELYM